MSLCDYCVHRDVCGTDDARAKIGKASPFLYTCDDFIDKSVLSVPEREKGTQEISIVVREKGEWIEKEGYDGDPYYECSVCESPWATFEGTPYDRRYLICEDCGKEIRSFFAEYEGMGFK